MTHPYAARPVAQTHVYLTPRSILAGLPCTFDLDPCAAPEPRPWPTADRHVTLPEDGLAAAWSGRVWLNPPYGAHTAAWLEKLARHDNGIALVFARTETRMFRDWVWPRARAALFLEGRPHFCRPDGSAMEGNSGGPLVLLAYGRECDTALRLSSLRGKLVTL